MRSTVSGLCCARSEISGRNQTQHKAHAIKTGTLANKNGQSAPPQRCALVTPRVFPRVLADCAAIIGLSVSGGAPWSESVISKVFGSLTLRPFLCEHSHAS